MDQPYRLDDATVDHAPRVYENQREDQVLFGNQGQRWAGEVATSEEKAALATYVTARKADSKANRRNCLSRHGKQSTADTTIPTTPAWPT